MKKVLNKQEEELIINSINEIIENLSQINKYDKYKYLKIETTIQYYLDEYVQTYNENLFKNLCYKLYYKIKYEKILNKQNVDKLSNFLTNKYNIILHLI